jgi:hypothetical protein
MTMRDGFPSDDPSPLFLSDYVYPEEPEQLDAWDGTVISSRSLKRSVLLATVAPIVLALLWVSNPVALFANVTATQVDASASRIGIAHSAAARLAPTREEIAAAFRAASQNQPKGGQSSATALLQQFQIWAAEEPPRNETVAAVEPAGQTGSGTRQPSGQALLTQFQTWAAAEDSATQVASAEPVQDDRAPAVQDARAQELLDAWAKDVQNARAEARPVQKHQQVRHAQSVRTKVRPVQTARAEARPAQSTEAPWPLRRLDWIN